MSPGGWWQLLGVLAAEAGILVCITALLCRWCRPAWQRTICHATLVVLLGALVIEGFGLRLNLRTRPERAWRSSIVKEGTEETQLEVETTAVQVASASPPVLPEQRAKWTVPPKLVWWPAWVWMGGVVLLGCRSLVGRIWFWIRLRGRKPVEELELLTRVLKVAEKLGLRSGFRVRHSGLLNGPVALGIFRREILLPSVFSETFTHAQQEAILAHELEHLKAHDPFWYLVCDIVMALWWWNPLVWYLRRQLQVATEQAADEASLLVEDGPGALAECLVVMGQQLARATAFNRLGVEGNGFRSGLGRRVRRLLRLDAERRVISVKPWKKWLAYAGSLLVLAMSVLGGGAWSSGEKPLASATWESLQPHPDPTFSAKAEVKKYQQEIVPQKPGLYPPVRISTNGLEERFPEAKLDAQGLPPIGVNSFYYQVDPTTGLVTEADAPAKLETRWFKLHAARLQERYPGGTNDASMRVFTNLVSVFLAEDVDLSPPKNVFYNDRLGMLMVRGTRADLKKIEKTLKGMDLLLVASSHHVDEALQTRWFKVDPKRLAKAFSEGREVSDPDLVLEHLRSHIQKAGVDFSPPKSLSYADRRGDLLVRGTKEDMDLIEKLIEEFKAAATRVQLKVSIFNLPEEKPSNAARVQGIWTRTQAERTLKTAGNSGWELLAESLVTVINRDRTLLKFKSPPGSRNPAEPIGSTHEGNVLPALFVEPELEEDGYSIKLQVMQTVQQFIGYDLHTEQHWDYVTSSGANPPPDHLQRDREPTPVYQYRHATNSLTVWDGQTMLVGGLTATNNISAKNKVTLWAICRLWAGFLRRKAHQRSP